MHKWQRSLTEFIMFYTCIDKAFHIHKYTHTSPLLSSAENVLATLLFFSGLAKIALKAYSWPFLVECAYHLVLTINGSVVFFLLQRGMLSQKMWLEKDPIMK